MWIVAAIDPQLPALVGAVAVLATALGLNERRRRREQRRGEPGDQETLDRQAAETILTQWKAVLEATQARADWERDEHRRCEDRNAALTKRVDELEEKVRGFEWEIARRDWADKQPIRRKRAGDGRRDPSHSGIESDA